MKLLIDLDTGEPAVSLDGSLVEGDETRAFKQYLDTMYRTPVGTEQIFSNWGFPRQEIMDVSHLPQWQGIAKYIIAETLQSEPLVASINSIELERDGNNLKIKIGVTGANEEVVESEVTLET